MSSRLPNDSRGGRPGASCRPRHGCSSPGGGSSPVGDESHDGCDEVDRALAKRLDRVTEREQRSVGGRPLDPAELAPDFVSAELALACGLTRSAATHRVLVAQSLIVDGRHGRTARLARAGLIE